MCLYTSAREEEIAIFMERDGHDSISEIECLLNTVAMVNINVNVENSRVILEQLQDRYDDIVHIAKSGGLKFFSMM